jgi:hypothetical protein
LYWLRVGRYGSLRTPLPSWRLLELGVIVSIHEWDQQRREIPGECQPLLCGSPIDHDYTTVQPNELGEPLDVVLVIEGESATNGANSLLEV